MAHLAYFFSSTYVGTPFQFYGRRDEDGMPIDVPQHFGFGRYFHNLEFLLHHTQSRLDRVRMDYDLKAMKVVSLEGELKVSKVARRRLTQRKEALRTANANLRERIKKLQGELAERDTRIEELE